MLLDPTIDPQAKILLVDDTAANVDFLRIALSVAGYKNLSTASDGLQAVEIFTLWKPDLVLLDLHMPKFDGYETLEAMRKISTGYLPILIFTADITPEARRRALTLGANDFLTKPGDLQEICLRVKNCLQTRRLYLTVESHRETLEAKVAERTQELNDSQLEILTRLAKAGEFRDDDTGEHTKRVADVSALIAEEMGLPAERVRLIRHGSHLHDVGKIGIPDAILLKPGRFSPEEMDVMRQHVTIGGMILENGHSPLLQVAHSIALSHHEWWDGSGYPSQLSGEDIPLEGRIVAVADVYDALISARPYKQPMEKYTAVSEIAKQSGTHFDPAVVAAFLAVIKAELPASQDLSLAA